MTTRKQDLQTRRKSVRNSLTLGVPFIIVFCFGIYAHEHNWGNGFLAAWVVGAILVSIGFVRQQRLLLRYVCSDCGALLDNPVRSPDAPIEFFCPHCDVIWETGLTEPQD